jgi:hypothetical protein
MDITTNTGTIQGIATLDVSSISFSNSGNINPGTSPGILTVTGNYAQSSGGTLNTEVGGITVGGLYDQLSISGSASWDGTLNLSLINSFMPADGNSFIIASSSSTSGLFSQIGWPVLSSGLAWWYKTNPTSIEMYCGTDSDFDDLPDALEATMCTLDNDPDSDDDGLTDGEEDLNKNGQKEPSETDPCDADTDDDGWDDGAEVDAGSDPNDPASTPSPDTDSDGIPDADDNCPFVPNNSQTNSDPLPAGDACQCGDVNNDFVVDGLDVQIARENLMGREVLSGDFHPERCNVIGTSGCGVDDVFVLDRVAKGLPVSLQNVCDAYLGP